MAEVVKLPSPEDSIRFEVGQVFMIVFVDRHKGEIGISTDLERVGYKLLQEVRDQAGNNLWREVKHG